MPAVFAADRLLKLQVLAGFDEGESRPLLPGLLHLTRVDNTGAAFGLFRGSLPMLVLVSSVCVALLALALRRATPAQAVAFSLVLGGAAGNLYDRLVYGFVVDFIDLRVWPVFNLADSAITAGVALLVALAVFERRADGKGA